MDSSAPTHVDAHAKEVASGKRFTFGANWAKFLRHLDADRIEVAERSLQTMLGVTTLKGLSFLDAGSGSGLFSLAASRLEARVHSFDYDPQSVECTKCLRNRRSEWGGMQNEAQWRIEEGSVLDTSYLATLGDFDIVYSWGVLHHTGRMWEAIDNICGLVKPGGLLFFSIYNDQGAASRIWLTIKRLYNRSTLARCLLIGIYTPYAVWLPWIYRKFRGRLLTRRGMSMWYDMLDWLGGFPFEVARPEEVFRYLRTRGFELRALTTVQGHGCNQFVFQYSRPVDRSRQKAPSAASNEAVE